MFNELLNKIIRKKNLTEKEIGQIFEEILSNKLKDTEIAAFMSALATKGETFEELAGAAKIMRKKAVKIQALSPNVIDTCGTGGDSKNTFNISTTTAFVVAGCGVTVAKHGNRSVSSKCGSADLLEKLGINLNAEIEIVEEAVNEIGIGFLFAPIYHSAMRFAGVARSEVKIRSIFNMLGPLTNPASANCQLLGVYSPKLTEMFASALKLLKTKKAFVVCGKDGLDEVSVCSPTRVSELSDGMIKTFDINPEEFFDKIEHEKSILGGSVEDNEKVTLDILNGKEKGAKRNIVLLNSGLALVAASFAKSIKEGIKLSGESIDKGYAIEKLDKLRNFV